MIPIGNLPVGINHFSSTYYWQIGTTLDSYDANITFDASNLSGISDINNLRILSRKISGADWEIYSNYSISNGNIIANNATEFGEWVLASTDSSNPVPVELTSFTSSVENSKVILNWSTATEINNHGFQIQRAKAKDEEWKKIEFLKGAGNSTSPIAYKYEDKNLAPGKYKYRLKQIDYDGNYKISKVVEAEIKAPQFFSLEQNYPNPFNPSTVISYTVKGRDFVSLKVYDVLGKEVASLVNEEKTAGTYIVKFNGSELPSGIYIYTLRAGNNLLTKTMILLK